MYFGPRSHDSYTNLYRKGFSKRLYRVTHKEISEEEMRWAYLEGKIFPDTVIELCLEGKPNAICEGKVEIFFPIIREAFSKITMPFLGDFFDIEQYWYIKDNNGKIFGPYEEEFIQERIRDSLADNILIKDASTDCGFLPISSSSLRAMFQEPTFPPPPRTYILPVLKQKFSENEVIKILDYFLPDAPITLCAGDFRYYAKIEDMFPSQTRIPVIANLPGESLWYFKKRGEETIYGPCKRMHMVVWLRKHYIDGTTEVLSSHTMKTRFSHFIQIAEAFPDGKLFTRFSITKNPCNTNPEKEASLSSLNQE